MHSGYTRTDLLVAPDGRATSAPSITQTRNVNHKVAAPQPKWDTDLTDQTDEHGLDFLKIIRVIREIRSIRVLERVSRITPIFPGNTVKSDCASLTFHVSRITVRFLARKPAAPPPRRTRAAGARRCALRRAVPGPRAGPWRHAPSASASGPRSTVASSESCSRKIWVTDMFVWML